jgi:hypothetical protein
MNNHASDIAVQFNLYLIFIHICPSVFQVRTISNSGLLINYLDIKTNILMIKYDT